MAEKTKLLKTRTVQRGQLTKLENKIKDIFSRTELGEEEHDAMVASLGSYGAKLCVIANLDTELSNLLLDDEIEPFLIESDDYITAHKEQMVIYERQVSRKFDQVINPINAENPDLTTTSFGRKKNINLPKLALKTFDGNVLEWLEFNDTFKSAIDNDEDLTNVQKFQYLRAQVRGEAARAINGLSLTENNYVHAMELLQKRYGQSHKVVTAYMRALWELPNPDATLDSLRDFHDRLESYVRGLSTMGKTEDAYGDLLVPVILDKLPSIIRGHIAREHGNKEWDIKTLRAAIQREIETIQACDGADTVITRYDGGPHSTAAFYTHATQSTQQNKPHKPNKPASGLTLQRPATCAFCKGGHVSGNCTVIPDKQKRHEIAVRDKLCFNCLGKHRASECKSKFRCKNCQRKHHTSLCNANTTSTSALTLMDNSIDKTTQPPMETQVSLARLNGPVLLKTAVAKISAEFNSLNVVIMFDECAQRSFITQECANALNINPNQCESVRISTFGGNTGIRSLQIANFALSTVDESSNVDLSALIVPKITTPIPNYIQRSVLELPHLQGLTLAHPFTGTDTDEISVLIGADYYWSVVTDHVVRGPGPTAVSSKLGYLLSGPTSSMDKDATTPSANVYHVGIDTHDDEITLQRFWDLETLGVRADELETVNNHVDYKTHIRHENGRYIAKLPWKYDHPPLTVNRSLAEKRTRSMVRRLSQEMREAYDRIIKDQLSCDYIELVNDEDPTVGHYLPHRCVIKESDSTPVRIVYNCSSSTCNTASLNDCLQTGPSLLNDLVAIMLRFRLPKIAISADIQKAFLQIGLDNDDQKYTKFFWLSDPNDTESDFQTYQFKVILFGAVCSPFILNATIRNHLDSDSSNIAQNLSDNIYVDNIVSGCDNKFDALHYYDDANDIMTNGGFQLRSWSTNSTVLRDYIKPDNTLDPKSEVNVLGIRWDTDTDCISYRNRIAVINSHTDVTITKRIVVRGAASIYDPLGYLSPIQVRAKLLIQKLWKAKYDWDQPISCDLVHEWQDIVDDLSIALSMSIKRRYFDHDLDSTSAYELHAFADSSKFAYGCIIYLRDVQHETTAIVMAKSRVAPLKELTIPQLELLATLIASNLMKYVHKSISPRIAISKRVLWSDSQIVLHWLNSDKKLPIFVANRIKVIKSSHIDTYKYCPTKDNPADLLSRGVTSSELSKSETWWKGPNWLGQGDWPICQLFDSAVFTIETDTECPSNHDMNIDKPKPLGLAIINPETYSSLPKLLRVTAYVLRFVQTLKTKQRATSSNLTVSELKAAETAWLKYVQESHYSSEIEELRKKRHSRNALVRQLRLFVDDSGLMRVGGRLHNAPLQFDAKFPILLPSKSVYTKLVVHDAHRRILHAGPESTMTFIRQSFWITRIRQTVRSVLRACVQCKRVTGLPYALPQSPPLLSCRLKEAPPFTVCGLDYTGAIYVKPDNNRRAEIKAYILLFTCANTRAVHLETVSNLTTSTFLHAFRRFSARRSLPLKLISDNASTFLSAEREIERLFESSDVQRYMLNHHIEWSFIPKRAPWHGGFWERMIGLTKAVLKKVLGRAFITLEELITVVTEIETVINNRPITHCSSDVNDPTPLTPSHLLHGRVLAILPNPAIIDEEINDPSFGNSQNDLEKRAKRLTVLQAHFWRRWMNEYVTALREHHINKRHGRISNNDNIINIGDVVIVHNDVKNRINWKLALVTDLLYGNDNLVRSATIKTSNGTTNRPINKLYPLEVTATTASNLSDVVNQDNSTAQQITNERPSRIAAQIAKEKIKIIADMDKL